MKKTNKKNKKINNKILSMLNREKKTKFNLEDSKYKSLIFNRFINRMMHNGKKAKMNRIILFSFKLLKRKYNKTPIKIFQHVIKKLRPYMLTKTYNVAGKPFLIPFFLNSKNSIKATFGWLKSSINNNYDKIKNNFSIKMFYEIDNLFNYYNKNNNKNKTILEVESLKLKKKNQQLILENKKNLHYRWKKKK